MAATASRHTPTCPAPPQLATKVFCSAWPKVPSSPTVADSPATTEPTTPEPTTPEPTTPELTASAA